MDFFKTIYTFEVLSDEPLLDTMSLKDIDYEIKEGQCSGRFGETKVKKLTQEEMITECHKHGTDPEFFMIGVCMECEQPYDDNPTMRVCKTCADWHVEND